jgi:hypothetical protein
MPRNDDLAVAHRRSAPLVGDIGRALFNERRTAAATAAIPGLGTTGAIPTRSTSSAPSSVVAASASASHVAASEAAATTVAKSTGAPVAAVSGIAVAAVSAPSASLLRAATAPDTVMEGPGIRRTTPALSTAAITAIKVGARRNISVATCAATTARYDYAVLQSITALANV